MTFFSPKEVKFSCERNNKKDIWLPVEVVVVQVRTSCMLVVTGSCPDPRLVQLSCVWSLISTQQSALTLAGLADSPGHRSVLSLDTIETTDTNKGLSSQILLNYLQHLHYLHDLQNYFNSSLIKVNSNKRSNSLHLKIGVVFQSLIYTSSCSTRPGNRQGEKYI